MFSKRLRTYLIRTNEKTACGITLAFYIVFWSMWLDYDFQVADGIEEECIMKEFMTYVAIIKEILDREYGKEVVFYDNGEWYSRDHSRKITLEELREYILEVTYRDDDYYD